MGHAVRLAAHRGAPGRAPGRLLAVALAVAVAGCSDGGDGPVPPGTSDGPCTAATRVGGFEAALQAGFTSVQGRVNDAVTPLFVPVIAGTDGACQFLAPPILFCDPACASGSTCGAGGVCVPAPRAVSVGTVTVLGLTAPVAMTAGPPVYFYTNLGSLPHPGFDEGAAIQLVASGEADDPGFSLDVQGVAALVVAGSSVRLERDQPVAVAWTAPGQPDLATITLDLNITQHGGTPGWIECAVPDTGSFAIPVALTNQLLDGGFSGFPALAVSRRSADHVATSLGCVELATDSTAVFDVEIPGLTSCSDNTDCTPPQICRGDLTCG